MSILFHVCRRAIADKFNKYVASIASKLNIDAYSEVPIISFPSFESYMSRSSEPSIFLEDCDEGEVSNIILELQNGKASDIPDPNHSNKGCSNSYISTSKQTLQYRYCIRNIS